MSQRQRSSTTRKTAQWLSCALMATAAAVAGPPAHAQQAASRAAPLKMGAVSSLALFPEATAAVRAYFDAVNAAGGVRGRKLQLLVEDDKVDPQQAQRAARKLVDQDGVLAHIGSASALECAVNAGFYVERGIVSVQGTGVDPACFNSPNIAPVNTGPYLGTAVALKFLAEIRGRQRVCMVTVNYSPLQKPAYEQVASDWTRQTGRRLTYARLDMLPTEDPAVLIKEVVRAGCQGVVYSAIEPAVIAWVRQARALKVEGIDWVFLTPAYTANVANVLGADGDGIFAISEFEPWSSRSGMLTDWRNVMIKAAVPLTSFSQGGYVAASIFVSVLRDIEGEITRESVTRAFKAMKERKVPLIGMPYVFGPGQHHNPNRAAVPVRLEAGRWAVAHFDYLIYPD